MLVVFRGRTLALAAAHRYFVLQVICEPASASASKKKAKTAKGSASATDEQVDALRCCALAAFVTKDVGLDLGLWS